MKDVFDKVESLMIAAKLLGWDINEDHQNFKSKKYLNYEFIKDGVYLEVHLAYIEGVFERLLFNKWIGYHEDVKDIGAYSVEEIDEKIKDFMEWL